MEPRILQHMSRNAPGSSIPPAAQGVGSVEPRVLRNAPGSGSADEAVLVDSENDPSLPLSHSSRGLPLFLLDCCTSRCGFLTRNGSSRVLPEFPRKRVGAIRTTNTEALSGLPEAISAGLDPTYRIRKCHECFSIQNDCGLSE